MLGGPGRLLAWGIAVAASDSTSAPSKPRLATVSPSGENATQAMGPSCNGSARPVTSPDGHEARTLEQWAVDGYTGVPPVLDAAGNGDGVVCGIAMPEGYRFGRFETALGLDPPVDVIYRFADNHRTPAH